jgi:hypothetical protein
MVEVIAAVIGLVLLSIVVFVVVSLNTGPRTIETLQDSIHHLLRFGHAGGGLYIRFSYTLRGLELRKYINSPDDYGVMFCFPMKSWTRLYFDNVVDLCRQHKLSYDIVETALGHRFEQQYLMVDFGKDFSAAYRFVRVVLLDILGVDPNRRYIVYVKGTDIRESVSKQLDL